MSAGMMAGMDLSKIPLLPNPSGAPPNFVNPPSLVTATYCVGIIMMSISLVMLLLRLQTNLKLHKKLAYDDYFCAVAWILATVYSIVVFLNKATARHIWDTPVSAIDAGWIKRSAVLGTIYGPAMWFAKAAILTLYLRLFGIMEWMRRCCYFGIVFLFLAYWSLVPVSAVYNFPHGNEHWDLAMTEKSKPAQLPFVIMALVSMLSDVYILVLPIPVLISLKVSPKKRLGLFLIFTTAILGIASSVLVFYFRYVLWQNKSQDTTWNVAATFITVIIEMYIAIIVSCTPAISASWKHTLQDSKLFSSLRSIFNNSRTSLARAVSGNSRSDASGLSAKEKLSFEDSVALHPRSK